ncbi:hypothetical protein HDV00_005435 [Rhizophlyctis rosea]|nr:hypothetical protein HDV00_005435 [Rhizophlyctis rosea]
MKVLSAALAAAALFQCVSGQTLKSAANASGRYFGTAIDNGRLSDTTFTTIAAREFDVMTHENSLKWEAVEPSNNQFSWTNADQLVTFAQQNNLKIRGHTLVWHSQLPSWVANGSWTKTTLSAVIVNHVKTIVTRYKGKMAQWDVVNEIFNEDGTARDSVFSRTFGGLDEFVTLAFNTARAADPDVKLFINDYNLDYNGAKATAMVNLVKRLKAAGVPIDGIGSQAHLIVGQISSSFKSTLQSLGDAAGYTALTEVDIRATTPVSSSSLAQQKTDYTTVVGACATISSCIGVTVWGITDKYSWVPQTFSGQGAALLWDDNYNKKSAYDGAIAGFANAVPAKATATSGQTSTTTTTVPTTTTTTTTTSSAPGTCAVTTTITGAANTVTVTAAPVTVTVTGNSPQTTTTRTTTTTTITQAPTGNCSAKYGQCGGQGFTGPTCCQSGSTCKAQNSYYSQCL